MTYKRIKRKNQVKSIVTAVISIALVVAVLAGLGVLFTRETKSISPTAFSVGGIDQNGAFVKVTNSIYTKDFQECQGLMIEPDFETKGTFQVFYYDENKAYLGSTGVLNAADGVYDKGADYTFAAYCRIMITPVIEVEDEEGSAVVKEPKIRFWEVGKYVMNYKITVDKDQTLQYRISEFACTEYVPDVKWAAQTDGKIIYQSETSSRSYEAFDVKGETLLCAVLTENFSSGSITFIFADKDGNLLEGSEAVVKQGSDITILGNTYVLNEIVIPEGAELCYVSTTFSNLDMKIYFK